MLEDPVDQLHLDPNHNEEPVEDANRIKISSGIFYEFYLELPSANEGPMLDVFFLKLPKKLH